MAAPPHDIVLSKPHLNFRKYPGQKEVLLYISPFLRDYSIPKKKKRRYRYLQASALQPRERAVSRAAIMP